MVKPSSCRREGRSRGDDGYQERGRGGKKAGKEGKAKQPQAPATGTIPNCLVAGACGGLVGYAVTDLQCSDDCEVLAASIGRLQAIQVV